MRSAHGQTKNRQTKVFGKRSWRLGVVFTNTLYEAGDSGMDSAVGDCSQDLYRRHRVILTRFPS